MNATLNTQRFNINSVIEVSRILSPTPVENNYWRNLIQKSLTDEIFTVEEAFELGRFAERLCVNSDDKFSDCLRYKQALQSKFSKMSKQ